VEISWGKNLFVGLKIVTSVSSSSSGILVNLVGDLNSDKLDYVLLDTIAISFKESLNFDIIMPFYLKLSS